MNKEDLERVKNEYKGLLVIKRENLRLKERKDELEAMPVVKEYLNLVKILYNYKDYSFYGVENLTDDEVLLHAAASARIKDADNIYIYHNTKTKSGELTDYNAEDAFCSTYMTLEKFLAEDKKVAEREEFEKNNVVIFPPKDEDTAAYIEKVRTEYFKTAIDEGLDSAKKYALEKSISYKNRY